ncbi:class II glutamine amidotransferase [Streptomyces niveiscabiei]|uniref:Gamma-glutamyl-hercynylcysteine sulfoxide hydrolase n=1 Tax=Streptomyces niveiscabiei TaxID=164115 RepID=A0ABW9HUW9_9ACTN
MCRHLAYVGDPLPLGHLLSDPAHSLVHQSWHPLHQRSGTVNADGFGVGWYADTDPVPARYRRTGPIWADLTFTDLARVIRTRALLAAVRDATLPGADGEAAAAPFASGRWLFSHNGAVKNWPTSMTPLAATLPTTDLLSLEARTDSAFVWALVLARLTKTASAQPGGGAGAGSPDATGAPNTTPPGAGAAGPWGDTAAAGSPSDTPPAAAVWALGDASAGAVVADPPSDTVSAGPLGDALAGALAEVVEAAPGSRLNLLVTDGTSIAATAWGDSLWYLLDPGRGVVVASEPYDGDSAWREVPDATLLTATRTEVLLTPLKDLAAPPKEPRP